MRYMLLVSLVLVGCAEPKRDAFPVAADIARTSVAAPTTTSADQFLDRLPAHPGEFRLFSAFVVDEDKEDHLPRAFFGTYAWGLYPIAAPEAKKGFLDGFATLAFTQESGGELTCEKPDNQTCRELQQDRAHRDHEWRAAYDHFGCGKRQKTVAVGVHRGCIAQPGEIGPMPIADLAVHWRAGGQHYYFYLKHGSMELIPDAIKTGVDAAGYAATWIDSFVFGGMSPAGISENHKIIVAAIEWGKRRQAAMERE